MAPVPIDPHDPNVTSKDLEELLQTKGFTRGYYDSVRKELEDRQERFNAISHLHAEKKKARVRKQPPKAKPKHKLDKKSVEHTVINTASVGGVVGAGVATREVLGIYDELKARGIVPTEETIIATIGAKGWSDEAKVYFWSAVILTALITLGWKYFKEYK